MALTSLKQDDDQEIEYVPMLYGYGTQICLNGDQVGAMRINDMAAGQRVTISAVGIVTQATSSVDRDSDSTNGKELRLTIQLTDMELKKSGAADAAKAAAMLYDKS